MTWIKKEEIMVLSKREEAALHTMAHTHALQSGGHFELASGRHASVFIDMKKVFSQNGHLAELARLLTAEIIERISESTPPCEVVVAPFGDASTLAAAVARAFSPMRDAVVPMSVESGLFVFDDTARVALKNKNVLLVDDVSTSGGTLRRLTYTVHECGGTVVARAALWVRDPRAETEVIGLIHRELTTWERALCPLCKSGQPLTRKSPSRSIHIQHAS